VYLSSLSFGSVLAVLTTSLTSSVAFFVTFAVAFAEALVSSLAPSLTVTFLSSWAKAPAASLLSRPFEASAL